MDTIEPRLQPVWMVHGHIASAGIGIGVALIWHGGERQIALRHIVPELVDAEIHRLKQAFSAASATLDELLVHVESDFPAEINALVEVHIQILTDHSLHEECCALIAQQCLSAESALAQQEEKLAQQFAAMEDEYLRARQVDVTQALSRVYDQLIGDLRDHATPLQDYILVAADVAVTDLMQIDRQHLRGIVLSDGTVNSHTSIVARDLGIPLLIGSQSGHRVARAGDELIVDAEIGVVWGNPPAKTLLEYRDHIAVSTQKKHLLQRKAQQPAKTLDGVAITVNANIEITDEAPHLIELGADGIGLFRTEFIFMAQQLPDEQAQYQRYRQVLEQMAPRAVTIRTLDGGADKPLSGQLPSTPQESSSQLGLRSSRYLLQHPALLQIQLRAMLRASVHGNLRILVPMLSHPEQIDTLFELIAQAQQQVGLAQRPQIGAMLETPAALYLMPQWCQRFDFFSIGSNDLIQYLLAADRLDTQVAHLYTPYHLAVWQTLRRLLRFQSRCPIALCGALAGTPMLTRLLLLIGLREFSVAPSQIAEIKDTIRHTDIAALRPLLPQLWQATSSVQIQAFITRLNQFSV